MKKLFYVYVIKSEKDGDIYIGYSSNLSKRIALHNLGKVASTNLRIPFELIYYEAYQSEKDARGRELQLKTVSSQRESLKKRIRESLD